MYSPTGWASRLSCVVVFTCGFSMNVHVSLNVWDHQLGTSGVFCHDQAWGPMASGRSWAVINLLLTNQRRLQTSPVFGRGLEKTGLFVDKMPLFTRCAKSKKASKNEKMAKKQINLQVNLYYNAVLPHHSLTQDRGMFIMALGMS